MKVVIISPFYEKLNRGVERFTDSIAQEFNNKNVKCYIYTWEDDLKVNWNSNHLNVKIRRVPNFKYFKKIFAVFFYWIWLLIDRPHSIILNFLYHGERFLPKSFKYIYVLHSPADQIPHRYEYVKKYIPKFKYLKFVAVSDYVKELAIPFVGKKMITVIYNGVDLHKFKLKSSNSNPTFGIIRIVTFAALEERKGIQFMIKALSERNNRDFIYHIYGDGPYKNTLRDLISLYKLDECVSIISPVQDVEVKLLNYDIFCLLSKGEAFPLSPLEAIACGVPVLTSNYRPYNEFVNSNNGLMVDVEKIKDINHAIDILYLRKDFDLIRSSSLNFDWKIKIESYLQLIQF